MTGSSTRISDRRNGIAGLVAFVFVLAALSLVLPAGAAQASKALLYNATGQDLSIVVNGRTNLVSWKTPIQIFSGNGKETLHLEMANTNGELLVRELEPGFAYVILYQVSKKSFAVWQTEVLETNLDKILDEHPANARAAVFNSTGRPMIFQYGPWKQGVGDELCVFTPNAARAKDLKFKIIYPDLGTHGPVDQMSLHVVAFEEAKGYSFLSFQSWVAGLKERLKGSEAVEVPETPAPAAAEEEKPPVLQEDLKDG